VAGTDLHNVLALNPALVTLEMDLPALKVISLLEVSAGPMEAEQRRAAIWASKRADIVIWCSTSYLPKEQQVWEGMPDVVKDNGFLFLTKVDLLGSREAAAGMLERVEARAGEEFRQVLAISAKQARAAMPPGEPVNRELFRDSGAAAVITTIKSRVQAARRADTDMAELLLARHVEAGGIVARRFAEPDDSLASSNAPAQAWTPPPEAPPEEPDVPDVVDELAPAPDPAPEAAQQPEPVEVSKAAPVPEPVVETIALDPEPEPEPEPEQEAEGAPPPDRSPTFERMSVSAPEAPLTEGRKRFSDRIRQMPVPEDVPAVPLRSTWKSKAETAAARSTPAQPDTRPVENPTPERRIEPRARPAAVKEPEPQHDDEMLSRMLASVAEPEPSAAELLQETEAADDSVIGDSVEAEEAIHVEETIPVEDESPRWAERLKPAEAEASIERSPRTSLFGSRKPNSAAGPTSRPGPAERVARPTEPVTRVRAPAPRPPEPPRPVIPSPEELATPRILATPVRPQEVPTGAEPQRGERSARRRIIASVLPSATPTTPGAQVAVPSAEQDLLDAAIQKIVTRATELAATVDPDEKIPVDMILDHSRETLEQVIAVLGQARSTGLRRIVGDLGEVQDIIMLMQLEKGHAPADDALTLLLQIRRDLETLRAV
jgi:hypothetical protein